MRARFHPVDWNEINGGRAAGRRRGHPRRGPAADRGRAGPGAAYRTQPLQAGRPTDGGPGATSWSAPSRRSPSRSRAPPPRTRRSPATGGAPARRSCWTRGGRWPRRGPRRRCCGSPRRLSMPGFSPDGLAVFGVAGRPADDHRPPRARARATRTRSPTCRWTPTTRPPRSSAPAGRSISPPPRSTSRRYPATWPLAQRFGRQSWAFLPLIVAGPHDGRLDGRLHAPGGVHARRALGADHGRPDARPGAGPGRGRRDRAGAVATASSAR